MNNTMVHNDRNIPPTLRRTMGLFKRTSLTWPSCMHLFAIGLFDYLNIHAGCMCSLAEQRTAAQSRLYNDPSTPTLQCCPN